MMQEWFKEGKFGISLHWGIYAVNGIAESWSFFNGEISYEDYMKQGEGFTAKKYDPVNWADVFKKAGAKYAVLTAKHHDGVALWDTKLSDLSVVKKSAAQRDLIGPYCKAMREADIRVGLYFSHLDWSEPAYRSMYSYTDLDKLGNGEYIENLFKDPEDGKIDAVQWKKFLEFHRGQLKELMTCYGTIDLFAFDGDWERTPSQWNMKELRTFLHNINPDIVLNSRMCGYGDYETPEQGVPIIPYESKEWEYWFTTNDSWGMQFKDINYKSLKQITRMFCDCIGLGGNVLWNIAPLEDGTLDPMQEKLLLEFGEWLTPNSEAVYSTTKGLPFGHFFGPSSLSKDKKTLYLFYHDIPNGEIPVKGIYNKIKKITILKTDESVGFRMNGGAPWINIPGVLWIDLKAEQTDKNTTVLKIELESELSLYRGAGQAITAN